MGIAHRTAARLVSRGLHNGKANGRLAMDTLDVTGMVMTSSLNAAITDSSPGMAAYTTGQKNSNNQAGVFPDNTTDAFDNPRIEYLGELLTRTRGRGFNVGIVTTCGRHGLDPGRQCGAHLGSLRRLGHRRSVLRRARGQRGQRPPRRRREILHAEGRRWRTNRQPPAGRRVRAGGIHEDCQRDGCGAARRRPLRLRRGFWVSSTRRICRSPSTKSAPAATATSWRGRRMPPTATRRCSKTWRGWRCGSLSAHSPRGFYLMVEGASIDKRAHAVDAERTIWDVIEFDRAVQVALDFARRTNTDRDPANDTLVIVAADHETGGLGIIGVGNERYAPEVLGQAVRDYAAVFRFAPEQELNFFPNYQVDERGYPVDPDPSRKILLGWAAGPDHNENWLSNRLQLEAAVAEGKPAVSVANPARDGSAATSDNRTVRGAAIPGFLVRGTIENGETPCPPSAGCPADTAPLAHTISGHTASDVPLSASGPGAWQFTGVYENSDVFLKMLRATRGSYACRKRHRRRQFPRIGRRPPAVARASRRPSSRRSSRPPDWCAGRDASRHSPRFVIEGETNAIHTSCGAFDFGAVVAPVLDRVPSSMVGRDEEMRAAAVLRIRLQPGPQFAQIGVGPRVGLEHAIVAAVVRPVVGLAEREIEGARPRPGEVIHREAKRVDVVPDRVPRRRRLHLQAAELAHQGRRRLERPRSRC